MGVRTGLGLESDGAKPVTLFEKLELCSMTHERAWMQAYAYGCRAIPTGALRRSHRRVLLRRPRPPLLTNAVIDRYPSRRIQLKSLKLQYLHSELQYRTANCF